ISDFKSKKELDSKWSEFLESDETIQCVISPEGSGKTEMLLEKIGTIDNKRILVLCSNERKSLIFIRRLIEKYAEECELRRNLQFKMWNGSEVYFYDVAKYECIRGLKIDCVLIDDAELLDSITFLNLEKMVVEKGTKVIAAGKES